MTLRKPVVCFLLTFALAAVPASASQFVQLPFDAVARQAAVVVRGTIGPITSTWDDQHEVIYSTATLRVSRYLGGAGPETLMVREVGGTVGDYTQIAVGFPELREGQEVVLFLSPWDDSADYRIEAYNQGKYNVVGGPKGEFVALDTITQGSDRDESEGRVRTMGADAAPRMAIEELAGMVDAARRAHRELPTDRKQ